jgi:hypothetical protein
MSITRTSNSPPMIIQPFNADLLGLTFSDNLQIEKRKFDKIIEMYDKKIDSRHPGKKREFDKLKSLWLEEYERAKIKKENYENALKNAPKVPNILTQARYARFKRFQS